MRRCGSADALTPSSRSSFRSRSLSTTPLKYTFTHRNILTTEPYASQKQHDDRCLREIDEYFKGKLAGGDAESCLPVPSLDLPQVQEFISKMEETERDMAVKSNRCEKSSERSGEGKQVDSTRRALNFDSPTKAFHGAAPTLTDLTNQTDQFKNQLTITTDESFMQKDQLLSLHNLWPANSNVPKTTTYEELKVLRQRLEEERLRRQHCENLIRDLQKRLLESHEKMAVAFKIDEEKDVAIKKLKEGWSRAVEQWKEQEVQKNELEKRLTSDRDKFEEERETLTTNMKRYEDELLKALDLVHDYKEEQKSALRERDAMGGELTKVQDQLRFYQEKHTELNIQLKDKDSVIEQSSVRISELTLTCRDLKKQLKNLQTDKDRLVLEKEGKMALEEKLDEALKREANLREQLRSASKTKTDLKQYYQEQVENIVMEKQKDFQMQLSSAEKALLKQHEIKEQAIIDAAKHEKQQLIDKHKLEVLLLEEKHCEEIGLYEMKVDQCNSKIEDLQTLVVKLKKHLDELPEKLHSITQSHWKETLKVVSSASAPSLSHEVDDSNPLRKPLVRQNTFTKDEEEQGLLSRKLRDGDSDDTVTNLRRMGSLTYRINETPQKIPTQVKGVKEYIEEALQMRSRSSAFDDSGNSSHLDGGHSCHNSVVDASSSSKGKSKSDKSPWK